MSTKSNRSAGTQHTQKGVTQGNVLVDPKTGNPVNVVLGPDGKYRLCVDANVTANVSGVEVSLDGVGPGGDNVYLVDNATGYKLKINPDGTLDVNVTVDAATGDNIAVHDSQGNELNVNPDGSINVNLTQSNPGDLKSFYNEVTSVANSSVTTIQTYTAPIGKKTYIQKVCLSGTNIAEYRIKINSTIQDKLRTYFGGPLNAEFKFVETGTGLPIDEGDVITIEVVHVRPDLGDFNSRLQVIEV